MTAVEWLVEEMLKQGYFDANKPLTFTNLDHLQQQAKEIEKQMVIDAYANGEDNVDNDGCTISKDGAEQYYNETYGSKGSDDHNEDMLEMVNKDISYWKQNCEENYITTPISVLRYISELEKLVPTSSQTEISDEEIKEMANESKSIFKEDMYRTYFIMGANWYREQLKTK